MRGRVHEIRQDGQVLVRYTHRGIDRTVRVEYAEPGVEMTYLGQGAEPPGDAGDQYTGLDRFGRVVDIRWLKTAGGASLDRFQYGFDRASNRDWRRNRTAPAQDWDEHYTYNGLYELNALARGQLDSTGTGIVGTPAWREDFGFDPTGNWQEYETRVAGAVTLDQSRAHNPANEITAIAGSPALVAYDGVGNMRHMPKVGSWSAGQSLRWDAWNRLVEVREGTGGTGGVVAAYRYDGMTRGISKQNDEGGTWAGRHFYYSDKWQILEERVGSALNPAERQFVWGTRYADDLVLRDRFTSGGSGSSTSASSSASSGGGRQQVRLYATHDQWHVTGVLSQAGAVVERYAYEAFGSPLVLTPAFGARLLSHFDWETRYGAYRWDGETGLYHIRYRYLHPNIGRWMCIDPLEFPNDSGNRHSYVENQTISRLDPLGLASSGECFAKCASDILGFNPLEIAKTLLEFASLPLFHKKSNLVRFLYPKSKILKGASKYLDLNSLLFHKIFPRSMEARRWTPFGRTIKLATFAGRWASGLGTLALTVDGIWFAVCYSNCIRGGGGGGPSPRETDNDQCKLPDCEPLAYPAWAWCFQTGPTRQSCEAGIRDEVDQLGC